MPDVTHLLFQIESGDPSAAEQLMPLVYDELRKLAAARLAQEMPGQTLQATALVHDAYLRLVGAGEAQHWDSRGHFFAAAAEAIRRILIEQARKKRRVKHGGRLQRVDLEQAVSMVDAGSDDLMCLNEAKTKFEMLEPVKAKLVKLKYFAGCSIDEAAEMLGISRTTAKRYWTFARAWLHQACAGDVELRRQVNRLLAAHFRGGSIIDAPAHAKDLTAAVLRSRGLGEHIGPYKLLQIIGEGGMGIVYMAEQLEPVKRKVALKLIKEGMVSQQVIARFEAERQALAMMDHVNIARVLDAGMIRDNGLQTSVAPSSDAGSMSDGGGRPFFVMELIHGFPITKYCDDNHLALRQRVELFVPVCQAIQHAHQKGIIHRDIKPSNVMVTLYDGRPVPKVIDFGVAKATEQKLTERTLFTQYGTMVGTLEYMSPEQAEMSALGVDTRSDIYSLGVLLYEQLTGTTPLSQKRMHGIAFAEILRLIKEEEPPKPSTRLSESAATLASISALRHTDPARLPQLMRGELDWIVMKTLEKDRNRRYETANGFAADLQRYLNDEPVLACPPSASYRVKKFARRYRMQVLTASLVGLALIAGIIGTTWGMFRAINARADADHEAEQKQSALNDREAALTEARNSKREADEKLFESLVAQARGSRLSGRSGQRFESLNILKQATKLARRLGLHVDEFDRLCNELIACLALPDLYASKLWAKSPTSYAFDFDGSHSLQAWTDQQGNCTVRRLADDTELAVLPGLGEPAIPYLSEDGKFLAVIHIHFEGTAYQGVAAHIWSLEKETPQKILFAQNARRIAFHPRAHQAALAYNDGSIRLIELASGQPIGETLQS